MLKKIDLVIVDEAHKLKPGTDRYNLGLLLSENSSSMIFLTATPHHGDDDDFLGLVKLLNPFISDPAASSYLWKRHIKEDVVSMDGRTVFPRRESETIDIRLTNSEREINSMINDYIRARYAEAHTPSETSAVMFLGNIFRKRAASSLHSLRVSLARRRDKLTYVDTNTFAKKRGRVMSMEDENDEEYEDGPGDIETLTVGRNLEAEKRNLSDIIAKIDDLGGRDTKFDMLRRSIGSAKSKHGNTKILLFTEYKDTLNYLEGRLSDKYNVGKIHGMMSQVERKEALSEFREGVHEIMLCTDAAGEGIDMQFCNIEFNYDIPWNPNRLEQRMGRIHRIGQKNNVFYYNLVVDRDETIDGHVLGRLLDKIDSIKGAIGSKNVFDILGTMIPPGMIEKIYKELAESPDADWEAIVARTEKEVELERKDKEDKMKLLFGNQRLDRRTLDGMRKQHKEVVDSGEIERFLEFWAETRGGKFEMKDRKTETVKIIPPRNMSRLGILHGTLNKDTARSRGMEYLVLGNRKIREILSREAGKRVATILSHPTREGILCVYRISVMYSDNRPIKSRIVALFANEDGEITEVEPESLWGYGVSEAIINPRLVEGTKNRLDEELDSILRRFHDGEKTDISKKKDNVKNMLQTYAASEIDKLQSQI